MGFFGRRIDPSESISNLPPAKEKRDVTAPKGEPLESVGQFEPRSPLYTFDSIVLPEDVRREIRVLLSRIENHSTLYDEWGLGEIDPHGKNVAVSFYGPPGTGKTMCAEALAAALERPLIDVSYAEIESKFVGETGKNIKLAFQRAEEAGAVLFFDEADSILGKRMTNVTQAADHGVNVARAVMLKQLDAFGGVVVFATNLAKNFDGAFVRRILQHVEVPLPDADGRAALWQKMVSEKVPGRSSLEWGELVKVSEGLSGGEIRNAVVVALSEAAARKGEERRVTTEDIVRAVEGVSRAKRDVGNYQYGGER